MFLQAKGEAHYSSNWWTARYKSSSRSPPNVLSDKTCMFDVARHVGPSIRITCRVMAKKERKSINWNLSQYQTRTTRTPAFLGYPLPPHDYPFHWVILDPESKEFAKISNLWILKQTLHKTDFLKLLDKMCKYEMDPMSIVEVTERTRFCPQTDGHLWRIWSQLPWSKLHRILASSFLSSSYRVICVRR